MGRYKKLVAAAVAGLAVTAAAIPTDAPLWVVFAGQVVTALAVVFAPANDPPDAQDVRTVR